MKTAIIVLLLGLIVVSQVESLTSGGLQMWGKRGLKVSRVGIFLHLFTSECLIKSRLLTINLRSDGSLAAHSGPHRRVKIFGRTKINECKKFR